MRCPDCGHLPPDGSQADPARCPECGIIYVKALERQLAALKQAPAEAASPTVATREPKIAEGMPKAQTLSIIGGVFLALLVIGIYIGSPGAKDKVSAKCLEVEGYRAATSIVSKNLVSPATAKYPYDNDRAVSIRRLANCKFAVGGYVDSQNGFGALIRTNFTIVVERMPDGKQWQGSALETF